MLHKPPSLTVAFVTPNAGNPLFFEVSQRCNLCIQNSVDEVRGELRQKGNA